MKKNQLFEDMSNDPAFLFYPGDYLRDTQCLSEKCQVAYDRIMCEHMRNICITQKQLDFFSKRLSDSEKDELLFVLDKVDGGFQIKWVAESLLKRRIYSESRRNNRKGNLKKDMSTHDSHMEIEIEDGIEDGNVIGVGIVYPFDSENFKEKWNLWNKYRKEQGFPYKSKTSEQMALKKLSDFDEEYSISLIETSISNGWQGLIFDNTKQNFKERNSNGAKKTGRGEKPTNSDIEAEINRFYGNGQSQSGTS